jgi:hypothetical protein
VARAVTKARQASSFTTVPRPDSLAFSYTATAAATSCSAVPELSKIVISSRRVRPGRRPTTTSELGVDSLRRQDACRQGVMQLTDLGALLEDIDHQGRGSEQGGL